MKTMLLKPVFFTTVLISTLLSSNSFSQNNNSGVIRFSGAIVSPPCSIKVSDEKNAEIQCFDNYKNISTNINLEKDKEIKGRLEKQAEFSIKWFSKDTAILIVDHI